MNDVQVRVPEEVTKPRSAKLSELTSHSTYLSAELASIAETPTLEEILDRIESQDLSSWPASSAIIAIDEEGARR